MHQICKAETTQSQCVLHESVFTECKKILEKEKKAHTQIIVNFLDAYKFTKYISKYVGQIRYS